ncbi:hypothetical protein ISCGN_024326 [Ixodes scapularis]
MVWSMTPLLANQTSKLHSCWGHLTCQHPVELGPQRGMHGAERDSWLPATWGTCESRCLESGVSTDPEPCGFARPRLAVRGFPVSGEKGILVVEPSPGCRGRETCAKCGSHDHVADVCEDPVACANCKGPHPAYSRSCPLWRQEKEILTLRAKENLSYPEAKQRFSFISKGTYSDAVRRGPAPRTESRATQFSLEDLAGPSQAPKQPAGKQGAPGNAGSTQTPQSIQARPPADRQPRASSSSQDGERGRRSNPSEAARLVTEQQGPPAAPSTSKDVESVNVGGSRPGTSKTSSAGSGRGRKLVVQVSDHVGTGKPASKVQDAVGAVDIADSSAPSSDQEDMEWQTAKSKQKGKKPVVPP